MNCDTMVAMCWRFKSNFELQTAQKASDLSVPEHEVYSHSGIAFILSDLTGESDSTSVSDKDK